MKSTITLLLSSFFFLSLTYAQPTPPFSRGVNLTSWFQAGGPRNIPFTKFTKEDFEDIQSLGCDVIRLPINLHAMNTGTSDYELDPLFLMFLDSAVMWAEDLGIYLIIDNHTFDPAVNTDPAVGDILVKVWVQLASRYESSSDKILYEVLNEPHGIADAIWGDIQQRVIDTIRTVDNTHTIVVGGADWNGINGLNALPVYTDNNLLYTFHFYDPFIFTHQGATWGSPSMADLRDVPFPYVADSMPAFPASLVGTWIENAFNGYANEGDAATIGQRLDVVQQFVQTRNVPVFCGEFGVYIPNSQPDDRVRWYDVTRKALEDRNIAWTIWDYKGGFGIFEPGGNDLFDHDLNTAMIQSLGLQVPPQTPFVILPDTAGLFVYRDFVEKGIEIGLGSSGGLDFYQNQQTAFGQYAIDWTSGNRYEALTFDFVPNKDLSYLLSQDYALDFFIKSDNPNMEVDVRFLDTKTTDPNDRPWRMRYQLNSSNMVLDGNWQHMYIPLSDFAEHGSWDDNQWHNPQGLFDWQAIDYVEFVLEEGDLQGPISFDQVQLTNQDTATVNVDELLEGNITHFYPNPTQDILFINMNDNKEHTLILTDIMGRTVAQWNVRGVGQKDLSSLAEGIYLLREKGKGQRAMKVWKLGTE